MAQSTTARFFSPKMALISLGAIVLGLAVGAYCVYRVSNENRISIGGFVVSGLLVVLGIATFFGAAFPKGCRACKQAFQQAEAKFHPAVYDHLVGAVASGDPNALWSLTQAPPAPHNHFAKLSLSYCQACGQLGEASVAEERNNGQYDEHVRGSPDVALSGPMIAAALTLIQQRGGEG